MRGGRPVLTIDQPGGADPVNLDALLSVRRADSGAFAFVDRHLEERGLVDWTKRSVRRRSLSTWISIRPVRLTTDQKSTHRPRR